MTVTYHYHGDKHTLCVYYMFKVIFSVKRFVHLPCPYAEDYTNQEYGAFFEIESSDDLT